jgi:tetratricopeptide (TPR) repeat protein
MRSVYALLFLCWLTNCASVQAQGIVFTKGTWADAVKKARKDHKLLFLHVDNPACTECSDVANRAFESPLVREKFATHFISYRIDGTVGVGKELVDRLEVACTPSSLFLDTDENPLARYCGTTSFDRTYLEKAEEALTNAQKRPLKALTTAYESGDRSSALLRTYIVRRREMGLSTEALLDEYVRQLPPDSLTSGRVLRFIFEQGPIVGSKADSVFRKNYRLTDSLYRAVGWNKAVELNNLITQNSIKKAVKQKDLALAYRTARFRQATYANDRRGGEMSRDWVLLSYYKGTNDTATYLTAATRYYDRFFMPARVDSIQKLDELDMQRRMRGNMTSGPGQQAGPNGAMGFMPYPNTQRYVMALNGGAWEFYQMTKEPRYLQKALDWSKRSLEYREEGSLMDTYAHLLYRLGRKTEALEWQEKAVRLVQQQNSPLLGKLQEALNQMKAGTL